MKKVCIWDLDGTLMDTLDSLLISVNLTMKELSLPPITRTQCRAFIGNGARYFIEQAILNGTDACEEALVDQGMYIYKRVFAEHCMDQVVPYEGIPEILEELKSQGVRMAILSNKPHERTVEIIENYFGVGYFDFIQGQCDGVPRKPDPESIYYVLSKIGEEKEKSIYIGDSEVDMITGMNAGVATIGVSWGFRDRSILEETKIELIADTAEQLRTCINQVIQE